MARNDELCVLMLPQHIVDQDKKGKLPLRRERGFRLSSRNSPLRRNLSSRTVKKVSPCERA